DVPWELFIIDDCSTDASWDYLQTLVGPNIRVARNATNAGLYGTLNDRVHEIRTPWTAIVFQDDRLHREYLSSLHALTATHLNVGMIWTAINTFDAQGKTICAGIDSGRVEIIAPGAPAWRSVLMRGTIWTISGSLGKTESLQECGFRH